MNKQNRNRLIPRTVLVAARWEGVGGLGVRGEGIEKYKWAVTE